jgi:hypothetical protein
MNKMPFTYIALSQTYPHWLLKEMNEGKDISRHYFPWVILSRIQLEPQKRGTCYHVLAICISIFSVMEERSPIELDLIGCQEGF